MTTVNVPARSITRDEARRLTDEIKADTEAFLENIAPKLARMYAEQAWYALDYETWDQYCQAEFGSIRLPRGSRSPTVLFLRDEGLSLRAISSALGLGVATIHREIEAGVPNGTPDLPNRPQKETIGRDGKHYPASPPTPPESSEPEPVTIRIAEREPTPRPGGLTEDSPGQTDAKAAGAVTEPAPAGEVAAQEPGARTVDELVQVLVDATVALEGLTEGWEDPVTPPMPVVPFTAGACAVVDSVCQRLWDVGMALHNMEVSSVIDRAVKPRRRPRGRPPKHKPPFDHKPPLTVAELGGPAIPNVSAV